MAVRKAGGICTPMFVKPANQRPAGIVLIRMTIDDQGKAEPCVKSKAEEHSLHVGACPTNAYNFWADALARIARAHVSGRSEAAIQPISVPWGEV
jgi:hypothetical protein